MGETLGHSLACPIRQMAVDDPDRIALSDDREDISYAQLHRMVDSAIVNLNTRGIASGDVVAVLGKNSPAYAVLFFAAWRLGFILMPLNWRLSPQDWRSQLAAARCKLLVYDDEFRKSADQLEIASASLDDISSEPESPTSPDAADEYSLDREALIIFSSGTTDTPRGVVLTWANLFYSANGAASVLSHKPDDIWLAALPFFHIGGISIPFRTALAGCAAYVIDRFDAGRAIDIIAQRNASYISVVSTMLADLIRADHTNVLAECRGIILGGAAWDESLVEEIRSHHLHVLTTYGLTETASMVTLLPSGEPPEKLATSGKALPHREIKIVAENGRATAPGETGRIAVRGKTLFSRYLGQQSPPLSHDGWLVTDDIGEIDNDGYLTVIGRADSVIVSGGENIDLNRIEREILRLPGVTGAVVSSAADERWGHRPVAFVEVDEKGRDEISLKADLADRLSKIMIPDRIIVLDRLPLTGSGKYDRSALRRNHHDIFGNDA
jgi:O-succinylbenzoic acid--CoA ligase